MARMVIRGNVSVDRILLAKQVAEELKLSSIDPALTQSVGVKVSSIPENDEYGVSASDSIAQRSLLTMGLVYHVNGKLTAILPDGNTWIFPDSEVIRNHFKDCGYVICQAGWTTPEKVTSISGQVEDKVELESYRQQYTVSNDLAKKIMHHESGAYPMPHGEFAYDVFDSSYYSKSSPGISRESLVKAAGVHGFDTEEARKMMALDHGEPHLSYPYEGINNINDYFNIVLRNHDILSSKYFNPNGYYNIFHAEYLKDMENLSASFGVAEYDGEPYLDENGDLCDEPRKK